MTLPPATIIEHFLRQVAERGEAEALFVYVEGRFRPTTWLELGRRVAQLARALGAHGLEPGERVVQVAANRAEWIAWDLALMSAGLVHVPLHASLSAPQIAQLVLHSGARLVVLEDREQAEKLAPHAAAVTDQASVLLHEPWAGMSAHPLRPSDSETFVAAATGDRPPPDPAVALCPVVPQTLATLMYTSGTTGEPKGVMLTHGNLATNAAGSREAYGERPDERRLCLLPLSHIYARTCDLYTWIVGGTQLALARRRETVVEDCQAFGPTLINGVPYFYDKLYRGLAAAGCAETPGALRNLLGGQLRSCVCGGAAAPPHLEAFHEAQGLPLYSGYGLTEASPVITLSSRAAHKRGAVGRPIEGVEVRIDAAGQIVTRGPHVMQGYWQDEAATAAAIRDGWLQTGDLGEIDADGFLRIVGRSKELLVLATGKNVAPAALEARLTSSPLVAQVLVVGEGRNYLGALLVPDQGALRAVLAAGGSGAEPVDLAAPGGLDDSRVRDLVRAEIERALADVAEHERIGRFALLERAFSAEQGELTPKLSLRRDAIVANFATEIERLYR